MSILTDLKAALKYSVTVNGTTTLTHVRTLLTDDTIASLIAVAEAVDKGKLTAARHALYPLVKEADHDRA